MCEKFRGEETGAIFGSSVIYLDSQARADYKVSIQDGLIRDAGGKLLDTCSVRAVLSSRRGRAMYVMDMNGELYVSKWRIPGKFHHSSFLAGAPVAAAGEMHIEKGVVTAISGKSGHYCPGEQHLAQIVGYLQSKGIAGVRVDESI